MDLRDTIQEAQANYLSQEQRNSNVYEKNNRKFRSDSFLKLVTPEL